MHGSCNYSEVADPIPNKEGPSPPEISWMLDTSWGTLRWSGREIRRPLDRLLEIFHNREPLFLPRRNVASNPCQDFRPRHAPKGARDLLLGDFHHPYGLFGLIT